MRQDELPLEVLENREIMFGYQLRLLVEDLKMPITDRVEMVMEDGHRTAVTVIAERFGFDVSFQEAPKIVQRSGAGPRVLVRCERSSKHGRQRILA